MSDCLRVQFQWEMELNIFFDIAHMKFCTQFPIVLTERLDSRKKQKSTMYFESKFLLHCLANIGTATNTFQWTKDFNTILIVRAYKLQINLNSQSVWTFFNSLFNVSNSHLWRCCCYCKCEYRQSVSESLSQISLSFYESHRWW